MPLYGLCAPAVVASPVTCHISAACLHVLVFAAERRKSTGYYLGDRP